MSPERDDYRDDDERDEFASRSIFSAGWFRAVLVLTVLAIVVVISLPYLLNWFEPSAPARVAKPGEPLTPPPTVTPPPSAVPVPAPAPTAPTGPPPSVPKTAPEKASPPASSDRPRTVAREKPPAENAPTRAPADKAPARATAERPPMKAGDKAAAKTADKAAAPSRVVAKADAPKRSTPAASGRYWIQLGAFKEQKNADALAKTVRDAGFPVEVTPIPGGGGESKGATQQQHELFVTETSVEKVNGALRGRGTAQAVSGGVAVKPAFSLQEAMTVSKRLTDEGLKVVIRPAGSIVTRSQGQGTLHAVRAGGYSNRTSALAARDELAAKGHRGFLAEGPAK